MNVMMTNLTKLGDSLAFIDVSYKENTKVKFFNEGFRPREFIYRKKIPVPLGRDLKVESMK